MHRILLISVLILLSACGPSASNKSTTTNSPLAANAESQSEPDRLEQAVYITNTGKRYHRATCEHLKASKIPIKLKDAQARGYTPCRVCEP